MRSADLGYRLGRRTYSTTDPSRHIGSNYYPVIPLAGICALPVSELATESAVRCPAQTRSDRKRP
jgi:hypothetical protein